MPLTEGQSYSGYIQLANVTSASLSSGSLPGGITGTFDPATQKFNLTGTPAAGTGGNSYTFAISAENNCDSSYKVPNIAISNNYNVTVQSGAATPAQALKFFYDNTIKLMARDIDNVQSWVSGGRNRRDGSFNAAQMISENNTNYELAVAGNTAFTDGQWGAIKSTSATTVLAIGLGIDEYSNSPVGSVKAWSDLTWNSPTDLLSIIPRQYPDQNIGTIVSEFGFGVGVFNVPKQLSTFRDLTISVSNGCSPTNDRLTNLHLAFIPGNWRATSSFGPADATIVVGSGGYTTVYNGVFTVTKHVTVSVTIPPNSFALLTGAAAGTLINGSDEFFNPKYNINGGNVVAYERISDDGGNQMIVDSIICNTSSLSSPVIFRLPYEVSYEDPDNGTIGSLGQIGEKFSINIFEPNSNFTGLITRQTSHPYLSTCSSGGGGGGGGGQNPPEQQEQ
jgi:hypothetical protein